jgi:hypothetical protein
VLKHDKPNTPLSPDKLPPVTGHPLVACLFLTYSIYNCWGKTFRSGKKMTLLTETTFQKLPRFSPRIYLRASFVLSIILLTPLSWATTVLEKDFPDLVHEAEVITVGTVTDIRELWDPVRRAPFTLVTFSNLDVLKGKTGESDLTLHFLGGHTPDGEILRVDGVPEFKRGERSVVFCTGNQRDFCPLVGIWQGVYRVTLDAKQGVETVSDHAYVPIPKVYKGKVHKSALHAPQPALPLSTLKQLIQQELRSPYGK